MFLYLVYLASLLFNINTNWTYQIEPLINHFTASLLFTGIDVHSSVY